MCGHCSDGCVWLGSVHIQPGTVDAGEVPGLRVPSVVAPPRLVHGALLHALHPRLHALRVAHHARRQRHGQFIEI